jgi:NAD(P)-dependent dehydrogenase (short-subunit alcohol dehydrogenase family)
VSQDFVGQTALITGSTSGIGRAVAEQLAARGARVIVSGRDITRGDTAVAKIRTTGGRADFLAADLGHIDSVRMLAAAATNLAGHVDVLVNNAGLFPFGPTPQVAVEEFDAVFDVNVRAPYFLVADLAPRMAERGGGAIVNISTMVANFGQAGMSLYGASKAAIQLLTKTWAAEFGPAGVRVNAVSPGPTATEGTFRTMRKNARRRPASVRHVMVIASDSPDRS